jgi:N-acetylneuraminate synthase
MSTGACTLDEIAEAVEAARSAGLRDLLLLKCTAGYPTDPKESNILTLPHLAESFDVLVGLSDHSLGIGVAVASVALGACFIEKHFTLKRSEGGVDSAFSLEPHEFELLVKESHRAWESLGKINYELTPSERVTHSLRPSLYFVKSLSKGQIVLSEHIRSVRPGKGLAPKEIDRVIGLSLNEDVAYGTPVSWDLFKAARST